MRVGALIVTYFPDAGLPDLLEGLLAQVSRLVIVDNGSDGATLGWTETYSVRSGVTILRNDKNLGVAAALNQGMRLLAEEGYEWILTSDQDSIVTDGCMEALLATLAADPNPETVAIISANRQEPGRSHRWLRPRTMPPFFERVICDRIDHEGVTLVITSGALTNAAVFGLVGPFREDFFIDFVDFEYCLRARKAGYRILVSCAAHIIHRVGSRTHKRIAGVTLSPTHHRPIRRYYLFRNAVEVMRLYGLTFPHWMLYQVAALFEVMLAILLIEDGRVRKLRACMAGLWDGLRGRMGAATRDF
jgi:rhamnosyltransferase